jgi:hypothetical protein
MGLSEQSGTTEAAHKLRQQPATQPRLPPMIEVAWSIIFTAAYR